MSTIGLYSTLYTRLEEYAELLDQALIQLKQEQITISEQQQKLGELLVSLAKSPRGLDAQLLVILLQDSPKKSLVEWSQLGQALLSHKITPVEITKLEKLANMLEYERANTFARMRGGNA
ncbi:hypothetical protein [Coleofasciculus sp. G2-EDA-02]|uniref:hypothetical protein n=1 Tax=Coleofasciculus sp. G2-EDA-02 TaxID=3069529 RepID=UPI0032FEB6C8